MWVRTMGLRRCAAAGLLQDVGQGDGTTTRVTLEKEEVPWLTCRGSKQRRGQCERTEAQSMGSVCNTCKWAAQVAAQALQAKPARTSPS